jgi:hypothetical protein
MSLRESVRNIEVYRSRRSAKAAQRFACGPPWQKYFLNVIGLTMAPVPRPARFAVVEPKGPQCSVQPDHCLLARSPRQMRPPMHKQARPRQHLTTGKALTRALQDWLGHRSIQHTVRYTELSPTQFKNFWR